VDEFPLPGILRRIRRTADCSQRELADRLGASKATLAAAENGTRDLPVSLLARAAVSMGGRLTVLDASGHELIPMDPHAVRDRGGRRFPAHLDTRYGDGFWWHGPHRYDRVQPTYTFDRDRRRRDDGRAGTGVPGDHQRPQPGDSPAERAAARQRAARRRQEKRRHQLLAASRAASGAIELDWGTGCTCPAGCELAEGRNEDLSHASSCACRCDVC
jgi:transcriptional regulator with XRE-family HTH domain